MIMSQAKMTMHNELASKFYDSSLQRVSQSQVILMMLMMRNWHKQWYWSWWWIRWWMALIPSTRSDEYVVALHLIITELLIHYIGCEVNWDSYLITNELASLEAMLVRNYHQVTDWRGWSVELLAWLKIWCYHNDRTWKRQNLVAQRPHQDWVEFLNKRWIPNKYWLEILLLKVCHNVDDLIQARLDVLCGDTGMKKTSSSPEVCQLYIFLK